FRTLDLWVRDLAAQARVVERLCLLAPGGRAASPADLPVPEGIRVLTHADVAAAGGIDALVREHDVVQINSGMPWKTARWMFRGARAARKNDRCLVLGVSSNRATTTVMNAQRGSWLRRVKARLISRQILDVQTRLAKLADGVYLVGHGLALVSPHANTHIGTASWITAADVIAAADLGRRMEDRLRAPFLKLCVAGRLEFMKGTHLAIEALRRLRDRGDGRCPRLTILGEGPERAALQELVDGHGLADRVTFGGTFEYPTAFHRELGRHDLLLLTNLNDEQPRVVFDAASQGVLPVCPDTAPYRALGVDADLRYERGLRRPPARPPRNGVAWRRCRSSEAGPPCAWICDAIVGRLWRGSGGGGEGFERDLG
ncbi:MAG: glycosyltransferase, partial [Pseudomonadota bacterium]